MRRIWSALFASSVCVACGGGAASTASSDGHAGPGEAAARPEIPANARDGGEGASPDAARGGAPGAGDGRGGTLTSTARVIHREHRAIPGVMFGGWGPHLGHLVRRRVGDSDELWFVDDACAPGACDVNRNTRVDYLRFSNDAWERVDTAALPAGVQQNTATIVAGERAWTYGVDTAARRLVECSRSFDAGSKGCAAIPIDVGAAANYVGAAVSPKGHRLAWLTNVKDGGGGTFSFFVDYGGGWNGPRAGAVGGYNDASYVNVAFEPGGDRFTLHAELVSGLAPSWSFVGAVGEGNAASAAPVAWTTLTPPAGDPVISTNDVLVDPRTSDTHLVARTRSGAAAYYFRPSGGAFGAPALVLPRAFRARLVALADGSVALVRSDGERGGLAIHLARASAVRAGTPIDWAAVEVHRPALPAGYDDVLALYTESSSYALAPCGTVEVAVVARAREHEVLHVSARFR